MFEKSILNWDYFPKRKKDKNISMVAVDSNVLIFCNCPEYDEEKR